MKTVGEILANARQEKKVTVEEVEVKTRIRKRYLEALERDEWQNLPSLVYTRGFIKNYSDFLGLNTEYVLSIFRRQVDRIERLKVIPQGVSHPLNEPLFRLTPSKIIGALVVSLMFLFFAWLFNQYQSFVGPPKIVIETPKEAEIVNEKKVLITGKTDPWAILTINGQEVRLLNGEFSQEIEVGSGIVTITVSATNKFGKKQEVKRTIKVEGP